MSFYTPVLQSLASSIMPWEEDDTTRWKWFIPCLPDKEPSETSLQNLPIPPILLKINKLSSSLGVECFFERLRFTHVVVSFMENENKNISETLKPAYSVWKRKKTHSFTFTGL